MKSDILSTKLIRKAIEKLRNVAIKPIKDKYYIAVANPIVIALMNYKQWDLSRHFKQMAEQLEVELECNREIESGEKINLAQISK